MNTLRTAGLVLAATLVFPSMAFATTYAAPPPAQEDGYPDARGDYEQSYVTANVNVRRDPSSRAAVVNRLRRGDFVNVGECRGGWCYVDVHGGNGWVSGRFIGRGENPYHDLGPAGPGIPPQEPGTYDRPPIGRY